MVAELHSAQRAHRTGRDGLVHLIKTIPPSLRYEHGLIMTEGDFVRCARRYSNTGLPATGLLPTS